MYFTKEFGYFLSMIHGMKGAMPPMRKKYSRAKRDESSVGGIGKVLCSCLTTRDKVSVWSYTRGRSY